LSKPVNWSIVSAAPSAAASAAASAGGYAATSGIASSAASAIIAAVAGINAVPKHIHFTSLDPCRFGLCQAVPSYAVSAVYVMGPDRQTPINDWKSRETDSISKHLKTFFHPIDDHKKRPRSSAPAQDIDELLRVSITPG
jgi:hypothetical protein